MESQGHNELTSLIYISCVVRIYHAVSILGAKSSNHCKNIFSKKIFLFKDLATALKDPPPYLYQDHTRLHDLSVNNQTSSDSCDSLFFWGMKTLSLVTGYWCQHWAWHSLERNLSPLTQWPPENITWFFLLCNCQTLCSEQYLEQLLWICPQLFGKGPHWW